MTDDELLDRALATYSECEPAAGLAERVTGRVRNRRLVWWVAGAAAAAGTMLFLLRGPHEQPVHREAVRVASIPAAVEPRVIATVRARLPVRAKRRVPKAYSGAPPLTESERALLAFIKRAPESVVLAAVEQQSAGVVPIQIDEIVIDALPQ